MFRIIFTGLALILSATFVRAETEHIDLLKIFTGKVPLIKRDKNPDRFGWENVSIMEETDLATKQVRQFARINFPAGSYDPGSMLRLKKPVGGAGFRIWLEKIKPSACMHIVYAVRFAPNFPFMKGGKLPGLGGGTGNTGGDKPNGTDGFSARLMWRTNGAGEAYTYLPNNQPWGTSLGRRSWFFTKDNWQKVEQKIVLNTPGQNDGYIAILVNDKVVHVEENLRFRDVDTLKIDQLIFETFFGGNDPSWAPTADTYLDIRDMAVVSCTKE